MSKNDYISDNLFTMRDRLRESTAAIREAAEQKKVQEQSPENTPQASSAPQQTIPESTMDRRTKEGLQAKQDLAGRLARDLAKTDALIAEHEQKLKELTKVQASLQSLEKELAQLTPAGSSGLFAAETDRLRLEYFRICGTLEALATVKTAGSAGSERYDTKKENTALTAAWIIGGAILAGALILAGATAKIFL